MHCKKILIFTVLLLFLAVNSVPLIASDRPMQDPTIENAHNNEADGGGGGEEHPWQDNDDDDDGLFNYKKGLQYLISLFTRDKEADQKPERSKKAEPVKKFDKKK